LLVRSRPAAPRLHRAVPRCADRSRRGDPHHRPTHRRRGRRSGDRDAGRDGHPPSSGAGRGAGVPGLWVQVPAGVERRERGGWWYHRLYSWRYRTMISLNLEEDIRPLSEFRADAAAMIQKIRETGRALVLTQRGHSSAVVLAIREYQQLLDELEL